MPPRKFKLCQNMRVLQWDKVPPEWTAIVAEVLDEVLQMKMSLLGANDIFAGTKNMQAKWKEKGIPCSKFELDDDPDENCLSPIGVKIFVRDTLRMVPNSISTMGPPCKFWIFLTLSHTKRTKDNVLGSPNSWMAVEGNKIAKFVAKGIRLVDAVSCYSLIEQPTNSLLFYIQMPSRHCLMSDTMWPSLTWRNLDMSLRRLHKSMAQHHGFQSFMKLQRVGCEIPQNLERNFLWSMRMEQWQERKVLSNPQLRTPMTFAMLSKSATSPTWGKLVTTSKVYVRLSVGHHWYIAGGVSVIV